MRYFKLIILHSGLEMNSEIPQSQRQCRISYVSIVFNFNHYFSWLFYGNLEHEMEGVNALLEEIRLLVKPRINRFFKYCLLNGERKCRAETRNPHNCIWGICNSILFRRWAHHLSRWGRVRIICVFDILRIRHSVCLTFWESVILLFWNSAYLRFAQM